MMDKIERKRRFRWINIFVRDFCLAILIFYVNYKAHYNSFWAALLLGSIVVLMAWHISDYLKTKRKVKL